MMIKRFCLFFDKLQGLWQSIKNSMRYTGQPDNDNEWPWWLPNIVLPRWHELVGVSLLYFTLSLIWTWPLALSLQDGVIVSSWNTDQPDVTQNVWNVWHFINNWSHINPLLTQAVFYPQQINLLYQSYGISQLFLVAPIAVLLGPIAGANAILFLGYWGGAIGMYLVIRAMNRNIYVAILIGWIYAIIPTHQMSVAWAADENAALQWIMLLHIVLVRWLRQPNWRRTSAVWLVLVINMLASGYLGLFGAVYILLFSCWAVIWNQKRIWRTHIMARGALVLLTWAATSVALLAPQFAEYTYVHGAINHSEIVNSDLGLHDWYIRQTNPRLVVSLADFVQPTIHQRWWKWLHPNDVFPTSQMGGYLGIVVLSICIWASIRHSPVRGLLVLSIILLWLATGLETRIWASKSSWSFPGLFWILDIASVFRNASRPGLFLLWAWIPLCMVLAYTLTTIRSRIIVVVLSIMMIIDFLPLQWIILPQKASSAATVLANTSDHGAVLNLPFGKNDALPLLDQMCHGRAIATGYLARVPLPVTSLRLIQQPPDEYVDVVPIHPVDELANLGIRYVFMRDDVPDYTRVALIQDGAKLFHKDENSELWIIPYATRPALVLGNGWWSPEQSDSTRWRWSQAKSDVMIMSQTSGFVTIATLLSRSETAAPMQIYVNGHLFGTMNVPRMPETQYRNFEIAIEPGINIITFATPTTKDIDGREIGVQFLKLEMLHYSLSNDYHKLPPPLTYTKGRLCPN